MNYVNRLQEQRFLDLFARALRRASCMLTYDDKLILDRGLNMNGRLANALGDDQGDGAGAMLWPLMEPAGMDEFAPFLAAQIVGAAVAAPPDARQALADQLSALVAQASATGDDGIAGELGELVTQVVAGTAAGAVIDRVLRNPRLGAALLRLANLAPHPLLRGAAMAGILGLRVALPALGGAVVADAVDND